MDSLSLLWVVISLGRRKFRKSQQVSFIIGKLEVSPMNMKIIFISWRHTCTSSRYSGSEAEASHRLFRMKTLGCERRAETLWKKFFSYEEGKNILVGNSTFSYIAATNWLKFRFSFVKNSRSGGTQFIHMPVHCSLYVPLKSINIKKMTFGRLSM